MVTVTTITPSTTAGKKKVEDASVTAGSKAGARVVAGDTRAGACGVVLRVQAGEEGKSALGNGPTALAGDSCRGPRVTQGFAKLLEEVEPAVVLEAIVIVVVLLGGDATRRPRCGIGAAWLGGGVM